MIRFLITFAALLPTLVIAQSETEAIWQGVYTAEQAQRGQQQYNAACSSCHSADLRGNSNAPSLRGVSFSFIWEGRSLGELFTVMREQMPTDRPGSLPATSYADILAFILSSNGYPSGAGELPANSGVLAGIIVAPQAD
ncbi:MAG: cytochrome c [Gammaproteobacteria bacterium]|jgi:cytochrome c